MTFSSTLPNAFDSRKIAEAKWLQCLNGDSRAVVKDGTISLPQDDDSYDTPLLTLEKIVQSLN